MDKIWQVAERKFDDLRHQIEFSRLLTTEQAQQQFFEPDVDQLLSPWDFPDMAAAVERIGRAIATKESVVVWGDFDADGVTSTAVLWETLHELGANVLPYIPVRETEGHGFSEEGLRKIAADGTSLVITVDHGITAFEDIALAREMGMEVIVTDHHEPRTEGAEVRIKSTELRDEIGSKAEICKAELATHNTGYVFPDCVAAVHPFRLAQPEPLAGCGVAYFLAYAVWLSQKFSAFSLQIAGKNGELQTDSREQRAADTLEARREFAVGRIELTAIGTIADLMPLTGNNRVFAALGLRALAQTQRLGLLSLYELAGIRLDKGLSVYEVGFLIGPRLNAPGRLADALESLRLLCTKDAERAKKLAGFLNNLNEERQDILLRVAQQAQKMAAERTDLNAYVLASKAWPAGVCGLAAGKVVEQMYRPTVVMEEQGQLSRGSARSIKGFDITAALTSISDLLESFGGHAMAAGFVAKTVHLPEIERRLSDLVTEQLSVQQLQPTLMIDAEVSLHQMNFGLWDFIKKLEPCGMGNPQPVFVARNVEVVSCKAIGKEAKHLKLRLWQRTDGQTGISDIKKGFVDGEPAAVDPLEAVAFGFGSMSEGLIGKLVDVVFNLDENVWNGKSTLQLKIKDLRLT